MDVLPDLLAKQLRRQRKTVVVAFFISLPPYKPHTMRHIIVIYKRNTECCIARPTNKSTHRTTHRSNSTSITYLSYTQQRQIRVSVVSRAAAATANDTNQNRLYVGK